MILVTVGMQLGFDRLIKAMDALAPQLDMPAIAQTGKGSVIPQNMEARPMIGPDEFETLAQEARVIVSHAGIGSVLTARRVATPIVLLPRRAALGEHRNDHQLASAKQLAARPGIFVAMEPRELGAAIAAALAFEGKIAQHPESAATLVQAVADFIEKGAI